MRISWTVEIVTYKTEVTEYKVVLKRNFHDQGRVNDFARQLLAVGVKEEHLRITEFTQNELSGSEIHEMLKL